MQPTPIAATLTNHIFSPALATKPRSVMLLGMRGDTHPALRTE
jgi:hypothetical protein